MTDKSVKPSALALLPFLENMNLMSKSFFALACATLTFVTIGAPVEWTFPRTGCCHEGIPFSDGVTGVLVWGGGDTINLTVGRADLWDHRGGYPWTDEQSYTNIVAAVESGDTKRLLGLFRKETPKGEPCNPYMLPLGRVVVKLQGGATLARGELDPFTGFGKLILSDGKAIELAMSKKSRAFAMRAVGGDVPYGVSVRHCMEFPSAKEALEAVGFEKAKPWADEDVQGPAGFVWKLPADQQVALAYQKRLSGEFVLKTARGDVTELNGRIKRVGSFAQILAESVDHWTKFWETGARIKVPEPVLQRIFDYGMYRFGAMTDPEGGPARGVAGGRPARSVERRLPLQHQRAAVLFAGVPRRPLRASEAALQDDSRMAPASPRQREEVRWHRRRLRAAALGRRPGRVHRRILDWHHRPRLDRVDGLAHVSLRDVCARPGVSQVRCL